MEDRMVCWCSRVTEEDVLEAVAKGARTLEAVKAMTGPVRLCGARSSTPRAGAVPRKSWTFCPASRRALIPPAAGEGLLEGLEAPLKIGEGKGGL
ncbi:MAG: (2Fe-2S)-binding protein [Thermanaerothrix sp.]|nr:(2Fe-2S)-binding protein [Thermanaerothrix sp.]